MVIYLDVIWLLNFCFDLLLLLLTAFILKRQVKKRRYMLGALIGSSIVLLLFTPFAMFVSHPLGKLLFSVLIVLATFGFQRFRSFFQNLFAFYFVTFLMGGGMIGVHSFLQTNTVIQDGLLISQNDGFGDPISWLFVLTGFPAIWLFSKKRLGEVGAKKRQFDEQVLAEIHIHGEIIRLKGLVDSGNQLYDPMTKTPVMIVQADQLMSICGEPFIELMKQSHPVEVMQKLDNQFPLLDRLRLVPYRAVGHDHGFLLCLKPDTVIIYSKTQMIQPAKCFVGMSLSGLSADQEFQSIIHPDMLDGKIIQVVS
ncbi:sigma-E processing peptidase SpoIIGA [Bacillus safensis]|uniref:sigma-E processing peptidase SpoIIGA n=1 Tax=Bacillus safensis TaxID=561879 RepID=UPI0022829C44|nr:sigma-E processing peptidase SpoIIGA [Bacillus safensis]MCY7563109.1 sigma-E processing peptidase SpoIIGA [Bacillus safensis]MCY7647515.1 sigma-E processing peptidase SpoIIGA [Bacillus safensis]MEC3669469.1 sigma-E processing peptidase SpoIIGA [Bacillus safensis]MEC3681024.1 sigma-E processing peptidase SpoIIGA [Bacillus safensis]